MFKEKIIEIKNFIFGHPYIPRIKDKAILAAWIGAFLLVASLSWFLTQPVRQEILGRAVNRVLEQTGETRRLGNALPAAGFSGSRMGTYFSLTGGGAMASSAGTAAFVFTFIGEGSFFPCIAILSPGGMVEEFIALNSHGARILSEVPPAVLAIYKQRLEGIRR